AEVPAIRTVAPLEPVLDLERLAGAKRLLAARDREGQVVRVHDRVPGGGSRLLEGHPRVLEPAPVEVGRATVRVGRPHDLGHRVGKLAVSLLARLLEGGQLLLAQQVALLLELPVLLPQLDEDGDLRAQNGRVDRLEDVVDRTRGVTAVDLPGLHREGGHEDDRDVLRALAPLDQLRELEPVELRHLDVEQDAREVVEQELLQRGGPGGYGYEPVPERLEDRL